MNSKGIAELASQHHMFVTLESETFVYHEQQMPKKSLPGIAKYP